MYNPDLYRSNMYREHPGWSSAHLATLRRDINQLYVSADRELQRVDRRTPFYKYNLRISQNPQIKRTCEEMIRRNSWELAYQRNELQDTEGRAQRLARDAMYARARGFSPYEPPVGAFAGSQTMMRRHEILKGNLEGLILALRNVSR
jgi:hypothetical protein